MAGDKTTSPIAGESGERARMGHHLLFMRKFFQHRRKIASIWPSSGFMARACISKIDFNQAKLIVELGAGTGAITQEIIQRLRRGTRFICIERDAAFLRVLRTRFKAPIDGGVSIVQGDVKSLTEILQNADVAEKQVDAFVSGLGTPSLPDEAIDGIFNALRWGARPGAVFSNITEVPWYYWNFYRRHFAKVDFQLVPLNIPPGGVYHCWQPLAP